MVRGRSGRKPAWIRVRLRCHELFCACKQEIRAKIAKNRKAQDVCFAVLRGLCAKSFLRPEEEEPARSKPVREPL